MLDNVTACNDSGFDELDEIEVPCQAQKIMPTQYHDRASTPYWSLVVNLVSMPMPAAHFELIGAAVIS